MKPRYGDIVILDGSKPIQSFYCDGSIEIGELRELALSVVRQRKAQAISVGDPIPDLKVGRVLCDLDSAKHDTVIDFDFYKSELGMLPSGAQVSVPTPA